MAMFMREITLMIYRRERVASNQKRRNNQGKLN